MLIMTFIMIPTVRSFGALSFCVTSFDQLRTPHFWIKGCGIGKRLRQVLNLSVILSQMEKVEYLNKWVAVAKNFCMGVLVV